ncbi:Hypothetical predicted protein [Octopus vulgaris]|uniref:Uncharacterized protein n=1 Tax=Octopus vulgaris TaxID=6645 RepID=A0AA36EVS0_OCTVU|nr:Hypothetical predicted protein [Octopus vulgaris]
MFFNCCSRDIHRQQSKTKALLSNVVISVGGDIDSGGGDSDNAGSVGIVGVVMLVFLSVVRQLHMVEVMWFNGDDGVSDGVGGGGGGEDEDYVDDYSDVRGFVGTGVGRHGDEGGFCCLWY